MTLYEAIQDKLRSGPQCPCGIAAELEINEKTLFPYLAEMLGREQVKIIPDSPFNGRTAPRDLQFVQLLNKTLFSHENLSPAAGEEITEEVVKERALKWYGFFVSLNSGDSNRRPIYYISLEPCVSYNKV